MASIETSLNRENLNRAMSVYPKPIGRDTISTRKTQPFKIILIAKIGPYHTHIREQISREGEKKNSRTNRNFAIWGDTPNPNTSSTKDLISKISIPPDSLLNRTGVFRICSEEQNFAAYAAGQDAV